MQLDLSTIFLKHRGKLSIYSMPQSYKFIVYFIIISEMAYYKAGLAPMVSSWEHHLMILPKIN